jgi:hypothetical protein
VRAQHLGRRIVRHGVPLVLVACLAACAPAQPRLMDAGAMCGKLRDDPADYASCVEDVQLVNEQRIGAYRRIYGSAPATQSAPSYYTPPVFSSAPPAAPTGFDYVPPQDYTQHPPPSVLCVGLLPVPGASNAAGIEAGCH